MDPHNPQANGNLNMGIQGQQMGTQGLGQNPYNQQMLLAQQQYMSSFNSFYGNNQMLSMDPFQQQQQLFMMQSQQMQPVFQQQQQQQHNHQQRLLEEQQRQIELARQQQQRQQQEELLRQQRIKEAEEQQRQRELLAQREKEQQELLKQQEEAARLAEEKRRQEEAERRKIEELRKIREEQLRKQQEAERAQHDMRDRVDQVQAGQALTLVATHFNTSYVKLVPFPSENMVSSKLPSVCDAATMKSLLDTSDPTLVQMVSQALSNIDVSDTRTRMDIHDGIPESNDLPLDMMPPLINAVMSVNCNALDVEPEHNMEAPEHLLSDMELDPARTLNAAPSVSTSSTVAAPQKPTVTPDKPSTSTANDDASFVAPVLEGRDNTQLRRQMASVGKQPKASQQRKKRDQVESLYDSLTDYFDPSDGRRQRKRTKTLEEEQADQRDLELIAQMEAQAAASATATGEAGAADLNDERKAEDGSDEDRKFYEKKDRRRKKKEDAPERPPTPTDVIHKRDQEWSERQRRRQEKFRRRKGTESDQCWNNDVMAEHDSRARLNVILDQIFDQVEDIDMLNIARNGKDEDMDDDDEGVSQELLIDRSVLDDLRNEVQKLLTWKKLTSIASERLIKLITILERNMRDVVSSDGTRLLVPIITEEDGEEDDQALKELVDERLIRGADAACTTLMIMTCHKMPKQVYIEDAIERSINLCRHYLKSIVFPASDPMYGPGKKQKADEKRRKKLEQVQRSPTVQLLYSRMTDLVHNFSNLACNLAANIFTNAKEHVRMGMLNDILNSLHRLPAGRNASNSYRFGSDQWISNTTVLVLQLLQSVVRVPERIHHRGEHHDDPDAEPDMQPDSIVPSSYKEVQALAQAFASGFLARCSSKGNKSEGEEDYRALFDSFLQDMLTAFNKPEFPAAEMFLQVVGNLLVKNCRNKSADIMIRTVSLEYLGLITSRLRSSMIWSVEDSKERMDLVVKTIKYEDNVQEDGTSLWPSVAEVDISDMTFSEKQMELERALLDYIIVNKDITVEYAVRFYCCVWYKEILEDLQELEARHAESKRENLSEKEHRKNESRHLKKVKRAQAQKVFLVDLLSKKKDRQRRYENAKRFGSSMLESDVAWCIKYLAAKREFTHSFDSFLKQIIAGITSETTVSLRTKAMRCLTQIIESDQSVLLMPEVSSAAHNRMTDSNAAVREATVEMIGKFVVANSDAIPTYYPLLAERLMDTGVAVRKRVIRIMREICEKYPNFEQIPSMLAQIVRRVQDEEGVKKLVLETFQTLWFQPVSERNTPALLKKVVVMTKVVQTCAEELKLEALETLFQALLKQGDKSTLAASRQIVDMFMDNVLTLENKMATENGVSSNNASNEDLAGAELHKANQERLLACLNTLTLFSKVRPELLVRHAETLQPYLSMNATQKSEVLVLNEVIGMLERVVPLMSHPSDAFLTTQDQTLANLTATASGVATTTVTISCMSAIWHRFGRPPVPAIATLFKNYLEFLVRVKNALKTKPNCQLDGPKVLRIQRFLCGVGVMARYFDFDSIIKDPEFEGKIFPAHLVRPDLSLSTDDVDPQDPEKPRRIRDNVFDVLFFFSSSSVPSMRYKAFVALGHLCARYPEYLMCRGVKNMYHVLLSSDDPNFTEMRLQALQNLEEFLKSEELKLIKGDQNFGKGKEQENLKEMDQAGSGLGSTVANLTYTQGLVTPGTSIATLIAMTTDPLPIVRNRVEAMLRDIDAKYAGMIQSTATQGVRKAYQLQIQIRGTSSDGTQRVIRGIRACDVSPYATTNARIDPSTGLPRHSNDGQAVLSGLYQRLRTNRQQRRSFLTSVLRLFSEDSREKLRLEEWIFVADNVAMFPYQVMDEPLYVIHTIDSIVALSGQSLLVQCKAHLRARQQYYSPQQQQQKNQSTEDDDLLFEPETLYNRFPEEKGPLYDLMDNSQACFILLYLKNFLMKLYGFTEAKVQEYSPSEAAKVYEKTLSSRKNVPMFNPLAALDGGRRRDGTTNDPMANDRQSIQSHFNLATKICNFRKMLLSLDRMENDDDSDLDGEVAVAAKEQDDDEDADGCVEPSGEAADVDT
ncbi:HEAT repeat protein [Ancylostoma ceylanicum]|uniref:Nipped-B protein n=1 Tax=Ancylostoma ceylanicum TaxID=53326 RepID=A0A0D6LA83_9BILA|nr:HEAT repeat protein [Ancylostoma ceylanicum]